MFKICASTVLALGAELISSDVIAFYELIKNAIDADSPTGADIHFEITLRKNDYLRFRRTASHTSTNIETLKSAITQALERSARPDSLERFRSAINEADDAETLVDALDSSYQSENRIVISDTGRGMSMRDLVDNFLVIGAAFRKNAIDAALVENSSDRSRAPYFGEKGIGRLSAMRLGDRLTVETAEKDDDCLNLLVIDWRKFADPDAMLDDVHIAPELGEAKPESNWSGTRLIIGGLRADWTQDRVKQLCEHDFARLTDPFNDSRFRPRIAVHWNETRLPVARMDSNLLSHAHASVKGKFVHGDSGPRLECRFEALDLGFEHPCEVEPRIFEHADLEGAIIGKSGDIPIEALESLGEFAFEAYWFNRQRLGSVDSIGERNQVRKLQKRWSGILLFRDGFRVLPYGEDDDWLSMDRRALASTGYLLNKAQFVGRVSISRLGNPELTDQANREGLRVCPEQQAFLRLLDLAIQDHFREFLKDVQRRHKNQPLGMTEVRTYVSNLEQRANTALGNIRRSFPDSAMYVEKLQTTFFEIKELLDRAQKRTAEVESENRQMIQMAGVGLLVEVVAHELARSTENTLAVLNSLRGSEVPDGIAGLLKSLRSEMTAVSKRLRVLDPLSVSGRQRREIFDLGKLIGDTLGGHGLQFARHNLKPKLTKPQNPIRVRAVKGMIVQIIENLVSNSLYWLSIRKMHEPGFQPCIKIDIGESPLMVTYEDNGPGIAKEDREKVFGAFFSQNEKSKRRGLGLYIARDCAEYHDGTLTLDEAENPDTGRLHRFVLTLPDEVIVT